MEKMVLNYLNEEIQSGR